MIFKGYQIETEQTEFGYQATFYLPLAPGETPGTVPNFYTTKFFRKKKSQATDDAKNEIRRIIAIEKEQTQ
jgi:hypothetical protein